MERIPIALLVRPERRSRIDEIASQAVALGFEVTALGRASISCRVTPEIFARRFGFLPTALPAEAPGARDAGRPGGYIARGSLAVPAELADDVAEVTVVPPARRL